MNSSVKPQVPKIEAASLPLLLHHNVEIREVCFVFLEGGREGREKREPARGEKRGGRDDTLYSHFCFFF